MPQGVLPFQYQGEAIGKGMTGLSGLGVYLDFLYGVGIPRQADQAIGMRRTQGYSDGQMVVALVLLTDISHIKLGCPKNPQSLTTGILLPLRNAVNHPIASTAHAVPACL